MPSTSPTIPGSEFTMPQVNKALSMLNDQQIIINKNRSYLLDILSNMNDDTANNVKSSSTDRVIQGLELVANNFMEAATEVKCSPDYEKKDAKSVSDMYYGDANDYREIITLIQNGDISGAIGKQQGLDTAPRNAIYCSSEYETVLCEFFE